MRIFHNAEIVVKFTEKMLKQQIEMSKKRSGIHRSDIIACPMKCYNRLTGMQAMYDTKHIGYFLLGNLAHIALHQNFTAQEYEVKVADLIEIHVDALEGTIPVETKTTRKRIYRKEQIPNEWIEQLAFAMSYLNSNIGYLMIVNLISFAVMVWQIEMNDEEKETFKKAFEWRVLTLLDAVTNKTPEKLEIKREECLNCEYRPQAKRKDSGCPRYNPIKKI